MFSVGEIDVKGLRRFENMLGALGAEGPKAVNRALNRTGDMARTQVIRTLAKQTSLPQKIIRNAIAIHPWSKRSSGSDLTYVIAVAGGEISLKYFRARETRKGVTAFVRGQRQLYEQSFMKGGSFARGRVDLNMGGQVFRRVGSARLPVEKITSGVTLPEEMADGESAAVFEHTVAEHLPRRLDHEISRLLGL